MVHLAGALARPVWIVLKTVPDWRWMLNRSDSPWYPTGRLFRRRKESEWSEVMEEVAEALADVVHKCAVPSQPIMAPVSIGELIDKITILEIKVEKIGDESKRADVLKELTLLHDLHLSIASAYDIEAFKNELRSVNRMLWDIEDSLRECEHLQTFGHSFVELARSVYKINDKRAELKRKINTACNSALNEVKSHPIY